MATAKISQEGTNHSPEKRSGGEYSGKQPRKNVRSNFYSGSGGIGLTDDGTSAHESTDGGSTDTMSVSASRSPRLQNPLAAAGTPGFDPASFAAQGEQSDGPGRSGRIERYRLFRAIENSYRQLQPFRELLHELVTDFAGHSYGNNRDSRRKNRYLNLISQALDAYQTLLSYNLPKVTVSTHHAELKPFANQFAHAINALIQEIRLKETLSAMVVDMFFGLGVVKLHLADAPLVQLEDDLWMDPGQPFASNISLDNFVYDVSATKVSEMKYAGDMYRIPFADAVDMFGEEAMAGHSPSSKSAIGEDRLEQITRGQETDDDELEPMIDLADIWIPRTGMIETYVVQDRDAFELRGEPLAIQQWIGDEEGPYILAGFQEVPQNIHPVGPASTLELLDALVNDLMRKSARQAKRQKDVHLYTPAGAQSARQVQKADDGQWVEVSSVEEIGVMKQGGVDRDNQAFMAAGITLFDRMAGNLSAQLGLGTSADTVGQERLIHGATGRKEARLQEQMRSATVKIVRGLGLLLWHDPIKEIVTEVPIPGAKGYSYTSHWKPGDREGKFLDYNFLIDVYSMQYQPPAAKFQKMNELLQTFYVPLFQMLMQQGGTIDMFAFTEVAAKMLDLPELNDIIKFIGATGEAAPGSEEHGHGSPLLEIPKAASTTRNYVRHNTGGQQQDPLQQALAQTEAYATGRSGVSTASRAV
jgi:hypothetical protein